MPRRPAVLGEVQARSAFEPKTLTDIGAGPGTASWAALEAWPALERVAMIDSSAVFLDMARKLAAAESEQGACRSRRQQLADVTRLPDLQPSDLVIASYALAELPETCADETWH